MATTISLNGTSFAPTSIDMTLDRVADMRRARDGTLRLYHWDFKRKWTIVWNSVPESLLTAIRTIGELVNVFTFIDVNSTSWSVIVPPGGYSQGLSAERQSTSGTYYYDITIELEQE